MVSLVWSMGSAELEGRVSENKQLTLEKQAELDEILGGFEQIFQEPKGLPPNRQMNHQIPVKMGMDRVNVRLYRYPHFLRQRLKSK